VGERAVVVQLPQAAEFKGCIRVAQRIFQIKKFSALNKFEILSQI